MGVSFISSANADGQCTYNTTTVIENGQTISKKEIKICDEVEFIGGQQFFTDKMKRHILLSFIYIRTNRRLNEKSNNHILFINYGWLQFN